MRSILADRLHWLGVAAVAFGCNSTEPRPPLGLNGSFGSTREQDWVGVTLHESGGVLSGTGWSSSGRLNEGGIISGTFQEPDVRFDLVPRKSGDTWHFNGTFERDTLRGNLGQGSILGSLIEFARVDAAPSGEYTLHLSGAISGDFVGTPTFFWTRLTLPTRGLELVLESGGPNPGDPPLYDVSFFWAQSNRPPAGVYSLSFTPGASPEAAVSRYDAGSFVTLPAQHGVLTLEASTRWALIGHFTITATDPVTGGVVTASGHFSAGCTGDNC